MGLRRRGFRVPEDIALVGCDDLPLSAELDVPLTTIAYPLEEMCRRATDLLLSQIEHASEPHAQPLAPRYIPLAAQLVIRESSERKAEPGAAGKEMDL
jgi:LacI family transcriptional regulator